MRISQQLKFIRETIGLTQDDLALILDTKRNTISQWEREKNTPSVKSLQKLYKATGVKLNIYEGE